MRPSLASAASNLGRRRASKRRTGHVALTIARRMAWQRVSGMPFHTVQAYQSGAANGYQGQAAAYGERALLLGSRVGQKLRRHGTAVLALHTRSMNSMKGGRVRVQHRASLRAVRERSRAALRSTLHDAERLPRIYVYAAAYWESCPGASLLRLINLCTQRPFPQAQRSRGSRRCRCPARAVQS